MPFFDAPAAAPARIAPLRIAPPFAGGLPALALCACVRRLPGNFPPLSFAHASDVCRVASRLYALRMRPTFAGSLIAFMLCACARRLPGRFPPFCFQFKSLRRFAPPNDGKESAPLPSASPPPSPRGKARVSASHLFAVCKQSPARRGRRGFADGSVHRRT